MSDHAYAVKSAETAALQALISPEQTRDEVLAKFVLLASQVLDIPGSFISVVDEKCQYIKASRNFELASSSREDAICRHVVDKDEPLIICDTLTDPFFQHHPFAIGEPYIRFYAGVPLKNAQGLVYGTLCVTDTKPHTFDSEKVKTLSLLSNLVMSFLNAWQVAGYQDVISGLPNRSCLLRDMQQLATMGDVTPRRLVLIDCIDIARAYELSRLIGLAPVEGLLREMASVIPPRLSLREDDLFYAFAPGRFALLTTLERDLDAGRIAAQLEGERIRLENGMSIDLTITTGESAFVARGDDAAEVVRQAVSALHEAIKLDVSTMAFDDAFDQRRTADFMLINDLVEAIAQNTGLYVVYQPKVCIRTGLAVGLEALIRWHHPVFGELGPARFIPLIEQTSVLTDLTHWLIDAVITQLQAWQQAGIALTVSVNLSGRDFARPHFVEALEQKMRHANLPPALLGIECLETERISEDADAIQGLEKLKRNGFSIALDDFGTGYSNIGYLRRLPLDIIKLDQSLIMQLSQDTASRVIARSIIRMLKELNYTVLAEGVECADVAQDLQAYGCDQAQGYYYSRPLTPAPMTAWLQENLGQYAQHAEPRLG